MVAEALEEGVGRRRLGRRAVTDRACQPVEGRRIAGEDVGRAQVDELQPVLDRAQLRVGRRQPEGVGIGDVAADRELPQRRERAGDTERRVLPAVDELEQLDGELDIADPAEARASGRAPPFPVAPPPPRLSPSSPAPTGCRRPRRAGPRGLPTRPRASAAPSAGVAGHRAGLEQRLSLPGPGPPAPVVGVAGDGADEPAVPTLGAQVEVDAGAAPHEVDAGAERALGSRRGPRPRGRRRRRWRS